LKPFLPEGVALQGDIEGSYDIKQNNGKPTGVINFKLPKNSFSYKDSEGEEKSLSYENAEIKAKINDRIVDVETKFTVVRRGVLSSKARIKLSPKDGRHTIDGVANFNVPNINFAQDLVPRTRGLRGALISKLTFTGLLSKPQIKGQADIKNAYLRLPEAGTEITNINLSLRANKPGQATINGKMVRPRVLIKLGQKVRMDAFGLEAKLSGDVNITHNRRDVLANGSLRVQDGKFQAYGQDLDISNGRLLFNGSPRLIGMDIRATRTIDKQIVGIHLGGTLLSPKSTLFAEPALSEESQILSYLITGNNLSSASGQQSALLLSAVRGLGITGSGSIVQQIGSSFGLDDVNIVTKEDLKQTELALGKRLGSRLYVSYFLGLFDQTQKIAIEYKINDVLSLEAQTTPDDFGLDFIYEIERD